MASSMAFVAAPRQQTVDYEEWGQWKARQASRAADYAKLLPQARSKTATSQATMPVLVGREDEERARTATLDARRQHRASPHSPGSQQAQRPLWAVCTTSSLLASLRSCIVPVLERHLRRSEDRCALQVWRRLRSASATS